MNIFFRLLKLLFKYWPQAAVAYFCLFAGTALALIIPRLTGRAIDQALAASGARALLLTALAIAGTGILRSLLSYGQNYLGEFLSQKVAYDLRNLLYDRLQRLGYAFHDRSQTGQMMSRATADVESVRMFVGFAALRGVYFFVLLLAISTVLLLINWKLALITLGLFPLILIRTIVLNDKLRHLWTDIQQALGVLGVIVQENLVGARLVRALAREDFESLKYRRQAEKIYDLQIKVNDLIAANYPAINFTLLLSMAGVLWFGGRQVIAGSLTQGELAQFLLYLVMLQMPMRMLGWLTTLFSRAMSSGQRIFEIIDNVSPVMEKPDAVSLDAVRGEVRFDGVSFGYDHNGDTLKDVSFRIKSGQTVALVGATGSGKSTIANLIPRFYDVRAGRICIDDVDIRDITLASLRRHVGIVHQDAFLFSATIRENISYGRPEACLDEIKKAAEIAELHDFIMSLPEGYETWVGERGVTLSGGQKQRLAIARTILLDPRIIIMDDSTSSVDTRTEHLIKQTLNVLLKDKTVFVIAQRLHSVQAADLILVLKEGRIAEQGTHGALIARDGFYRQLYELQFRHQEERDETSGPPIFQPIPETPPDEYNYPQPRGRGGRPPGSLSASDDLVFGKPYDTRVISRLIKYFAEYKMALPLTVAATIIYTLTLVANPYLAGLAIDRYIITQNLNGLFIIVLIFITNALLNLVSFYAQIRAEAAVGQGLLLKLRCQVFDHLQRMSAGFFDRNEVGRIMSRVQNDIGQLGEFLDSGAFWVTGEVVSLLAIMLVMFALNPPLALAALSVVPFLLIAISIWQEKARITFIKVRQAIAAVNGALQENISGIRVIQSLSREDINFQRFEKTNQAHLRANLEAGRLSAIMIPMVELLLALATALVIYIGGVMVLRGSLLVGTLIAFTLYIQRFFDPIRMLTMEYAQLQRAMASGVRVFELLDVKPDIVDAPLSRKAPALKGDICFENVSFGYEPGLDVLHDINLRLRPGETTAVVGMTGAGKSTLVSLIARLYDVQQGRILVDGFDLKQLELASYRRQLGLVLQDPVLFSGSIRENIRYGRLEATDQAVEDAARSVGAHEFIVRLDKGYDTPLQERGQNLSMGQRQLISFARALLADPAILLLDEATANVDSFSEFILQQALEKLRQGRTAVVIAHRLSTIRDADHIIVLDRGRVVEQGRHDELAAQGRIYSRLYDLAVRGFTARAGNSTGEQ